jgi:hypothetical protein
LNKSLFGKIQKTKKGRFLLETAFFSAHDSCYFSESRRQEVISKQPGLVKSEIGA